MSKKVLATEVALKELTKFLKKHKAKEFRRGTIQVDKISEDYIDVLEALEFGNLTFDEKGNPKYTLIEPIVPEEKGADASLGIREITFRTRIKPSVKADLMDGLDVQKQAGKFSMRYVSYIIQQPIAILDKFCNDDYDALSQICSVF